MKVNKLKFLTIIMLLLIVVASCSKQDEEISPIIGDNELSKTSKINDVYSIAADFIVPPSGDLSGQADANAIETALNNAKTFGGIVYLSDGNPSTIDHYYTSRNIVVEGFDGTLVGESMYNTIIHAGRMSEAVGFQSAFSSYWFSIGYTNQFATVLQLDYSTGNVEIKNFSILIKDDQPTDLINDAYGNKRTYISTFIEILGGEHNTLIENVRLVGKESNAIGNEEGMNSAYGIHVMPGPLFEYRKGDLSIKNVEIVNTAYGAIMFMKYNNNSIININNVIAKNVGHGIYAGDVYESLINITNMDISIHSRGFHGMWMWSIPDGLKISENRIEGNRFYGIGLSYIDNAEIYDNLIINPNGCCWWSYGITLRRYCNNNKVTNNHFENFSNLGGGIRIWSNSNGNIIKHNDYKNSNLTGWTSNFPNGPGALIISSDSQNNTIHEMKFPASGGMGNILCQMVLDLSDNPETYFYDGANKIHNWQSCENLAIIGNPKLESEAIPEFTYRH
jgi:Right handed beta helix region